MEEGGSFEIWGRLRGEGRVGPQSWEGVARAVVCGEVFGWAGRFLTKMSSIRLEWGIE